MSEHLRNGAPEGGNAAKETLENSVNERLAKLADHPDAEISGSAKEIAQALAKNPEGLKEASDRLSVLDGHVRKVEGQKNLAMAGVVSGDFERKTA